MNIQKILYPTDFSECSEPVMSVASSLARDADAELLIVHVEDTPVIAAGGGAMDYGLVETPTEELKQWLQAVSPTDSRVKYSHHLIRGNPADSILRFAENHETDLIVMGTHGRTGLTRLLMGSVAETVVRRATCPVLTIRQPVAEAADVLTDANHESNVTPPSSTLHDAMKGASEQPGERLQDYQG